MDNKITLLKKQIEKNISLEINYNYDRYVGEANIHIDNEDGSSTTHELLFDIPAGYYD